MKEVIYYSFKKNYLLLAFLLIGIFCIIGCIIYNPSFAFWWQKQVIMGILILALIIWCYKYLFKHKMAEWDDEYIKIDHTNPIKWTDFSLAEERIIKCCGKMRRIVVLLPKEDINYKYNWLQKHNGEFTPFSVPLYGIISQEDEEKILREIARKIRLKIL